MQLHFRILFAVIMGLCAIGLVLIPELVYVRDIYENGNARANTMFKLTYQAYIMFGMTMIYAIFRLLIIGKNKILKALAVIGLILFVWTCGYFGNSVHAWFGEVWKPSEYKGLNATAFLETDFSEDVGGIKWLKENVKDVEVVLEANGDSYSEYERVSAMTVSRQSWDGMCMSGCGEETLLTLMPRSQMSRIFILRQMKHM